MLGGRKVRSNKGKKRGAYGPRTGKTRSGKRFRTVTKTRKVGRKTRSNKGKKRTPYGPRTGKTRSGRKFRGGNQEVRDMLNELLEEPDSYNPDEKEGENTVQQTIIKKFKEMPDNKGEEAAKCFETTGGSDLHSHPWDELKDCLVDSGLTRAEMEPVFE